MRIHVIHENEDWLPPFAAARRLGLPFITKDNQGGKGLGVQRFDAYEAFDAYLDGDGFVPPTDHTLLLQEYVEPVEPFITRVEVVGARFLYALTAEDARPWVDLARRWGAEIARFLGRLLEEEAPPAGRAA